MASGVGVSPSALSTPSFGDGSWRSAPARRNSSSRFAACSIRLIEWSSRHARGIDDAERRAAGVLNLDAHRALLAPVQKVLIGPSLDFVVAVELGVLLFDLGNELRLRPQLAKLIFISGDLGASRCDIRLG